MEMSRWNPFKFQRNQPMRSSRSQEESSDMTGMNMMPMDMMSAMMRNPFQAMQQMMREPMFGMPEAMGAGGMMDRWFGDFSPRTFVPRIDIVDAGKTLKVTAELPGMTADDIDLQVQQGSLVLTGEKRIETSSEEDGCYHTERSFGSFRRVIPLPEDLNVDKVDARFDNGVLSIDIPKRENGRAKSTRINVKTR